MSFSNKLSNLLFQKDLNDCTEAELQNAAAAFPFFGPVQLLKLQKLEENSDAYRQQYQRAALHFSTPAHFSFFLHREPDEVDVPFGSSTAETEMLEHPVVEGVVIEVENQIDETQPFSNSDVPSKTETDSVTQLAFEPYHTVDYFASQGIKLSVAEAEKDKFGKQLKSFTEWLKTMKKLPAKEQAVAGDAQVDKKVSGLAQLSVAEAQVVTEPMAEVWEKQGVPEKAIEVYEKLSLLNPSKLAYFAAKIEALKNK